MSEKLSPRSPFKPAIHPTMVVVQRDGFVRLKASRDIVALIQKDANGVFRFKTKDGAGKWRNHFSRSAFRSIKLARIEVCKWL